MPAAEDGLRHLLNEWDPIGVADLVQDEYDCMLRPLRDLLRDGADQRRIGNFLRQELEDHFGLTPLPSEPAAMAARVMSWWTSACRTDLPGSV
ncbi:hypothetical protein [Streptomyces sp. TS71-3]|uniref:hypothetical protein n=1 Tax=Streptomyces sp. TS71-3 TaxID=2733862 RepID=UPI001B2AC836|nr:hypothetical protein [Streptomyces sp. TS71-3]GHJ35605.1 hypothetical protein Sm713_12140 [Streptomyces sp. TS71-3]